MFEHTLILGSKGRYETTAEHIESVRKRHAEDLPATPREERREAVKHATVQRLWNERRRNRRHKTTI